MKDDRCRICKDAQIGPSMLAKMKPNHMCDSCFFIPKGTSVDKLILAKKLVVTPHGWAYAKSPLSSELIEYE